MIRGVLGRIGGERITGWAFDSRNPSVRLEIRARLGEREFGRTEASIPRQNLRKLSGDKDAAHGYMLSLPSSLTASELAELVVEAASPGTDEWQELPRHLPDPISGERPPTPASLPSAVSEPRVRGRGDAASPPAPPWSKQFWTDSSDRPQFGDDGAFPVFVLGPARSGTSAVFAALTQATRYRGFLEGHLLDVAVRLDAEIAFQIERRHSRWSADEVATWHLGREPRSRLRDGLKSLLRVVADGYTTQYWIDKTPTPEMVQSAPLLAESWANARFIFMKRRGIENVMSRLRKFGGANFEGQCLNWATIMSHWRETRPSIVGKYVEVEQLSLLRDPVGSAATIGGLIGLSEPEITALATQLGETRAQVTDPQMRIVADIVETGWSDEMIATFRRICGPEMEAYGYSYDEGYHRDTGGDGRASSGVA
jgi:hypothetical protein